MLAKKSSFSDISDRLAGGFGTRLDRVQAHVFIVLFHQFGDKGVLIDSC